MKAKFNKDTLNKALLFLQSGMPSKPIIPTEGYIKFDISENGKAYISICNTKTEMTSYNIVECDTPFSFIIDAVKIIRVIANFPSDEIKVSAKEVEGEVASISITGGGKKRYTISCMKSNNFGKWPELDIKEATDVISFDMGTYNKTIRDCCNNVSSNDIRPSMANICFSSSEEGNLIMAGLSNSKMVIANTNIKFKGRTLVSMDFGTYIRSLTDSGECKMTIWKNQIRLDYGSNVIKMSAVHGEVFKFESIMKQKAEEFVLIDRKEMIGSLNRLESFKRDSSNGITATINNSEILLESANDFGDAIEDVYIDNEFDMENKFSFNLMETKAILSNLDCEKARLYVQGTKPLFFNSHEDPNEKTWITSQIMKIEKVEKPELEEIKS